MKTYRPGNNRFTRTQWLDLQGMVKHEAITLNAATRKALIRRKLIQATPDGYAPTAWGRQVADATNFEVAAFSVERVWKNEC